MKTKKILAGVLAVIVLVILGVVLIGGNIDSIVKSAVEKYGTEAAGAKTTLNSVSLSLTSGEGTLEGFSVKNPEGFSGNNAIAFGKIAVKIDPKSVAGDGSIVIQELTISEPEVIYEILNDGTNNLAKIQQNVAAYVRSLRHDFRPPMRREKEEEAKKEAPKEERTIIIDKLLIEGGHVKLNHALLAEKAMDIPLPNIELTGLGRGPRGLAPGMVAQIVLSQIISKAMMASQSMIVDKLREQGADSLKESLKESDVGKAIGNLIGQ